LVINDFSELVVKPVFYALFKLMGFFLNLPSELFVVIFNLVCEALMFLSYFLFEAICIIFFTSCSKLSVFVSYFGPEIFVFL